MNSIEVEVDVLPKIKIDYPNKTKLSQLTSKMQYVLVDDNYKTLHQPFYCKDYFNEIIATEHDGKPRTQYGFRSEKFPFNILEQDTFKLALLFTGDSYNLKENEYAKKLLALLNVVETNRGYILSTIEETEDDKNLVLNSDTKWMDTPVYFSFFTLLIRLAYNYELIQDFKTFINKFEITDSSKFINRDEKYSINGSKDFMIFLYNGGTIDQTWKQYLLSDCSTLHNDTGMVSYYSLNVGKIKM